MVLYLSSISMAWLIANGPLWIGAHTAIPRWLASKSGESDRHCERCGTPVIKKDLEQWFFRTTAYTEELLDFSDLDWP
jgi:hypothetical protein